MCKRFDILFPLSVGVMSLCVWDYVFSRIITFKRTFLFGPQEVLSERIPGYISCKQVLFSQVWNIIFVPLRDIIIDFCNCLWCKKDILQCLLILNGRSISKLTLDWGHELLQALGEFFSQTKRNPFSKCRNFAMGQKASGIC